MTQDTGADRAPINIPCQRASWWRFDALRAERPYRDALLLERVFLSCAKTRHTPWIGRVCKHGWSRRAVYGARRKARKAR